MKTKMAYHLPYLLQFENAYGGKRKFRALLESMYSLKKQNRSYNDIARKLSTDKRSPCSVSSSTIDSWCKEYSILPKTKKHYWGKR